MPVLLINSGRAARQSDIRFVCAKKLMSKESIHPGLSKGLWKCRFFEQAGICLVKSSKKLFNTAKTGSQCIFFIFQESRETTSSAFHITLVSPVRRYRRYFYGSQRFRQYVPRKT